MKERLVICNEEDTDVLLKVDADYKYLQAYISLLTYLLTSRLAASKVI